MKYITKVERKRCRCITVITPAAAVALRETVSAFLRPSLPTFLFPTVIGRYLWVVRPVILLYDFNSQSFCRSWRSLFKSSANSLSTGFKLLRRERNFDASNYSNDEKSNLRHCTKDKLNIHDTNIEQDLSIIPDTLKKRTSIFNSSCILKTQTIYKNFQF